MAKPVQVQFMVKSGSKKISYKWWHWFKEHQSSLSIRTGGSTTLVQIACTTAETMKQYFDLFCMSDQK